MMAFNFSLAEADPGGIGRWISPLLVHAVIWALFTIWAGLVLFLPRRPESDDDDLDRDLAEEEAESAGARAAGIVLYLVALLIVILAGTFCEVPALIAASVLCAAGLVIAYMVRMQVRASRVATGAGFLGAILGALVIFQYAQRNMWSAREALAAGMMTKLHEAQKRCEKYRGTAGSIEQMANDILVEGPKLNNGKNQGYIFDTRPDLNLKWIITARPDSALSCLLAHFYADGSGGTIRCSRGKPADMNSQPFRGGAEKE